MTLTDVALRRATLVAMPKGINHITVAPAPISVRLGDSQERLDALVRHYNAPGASPVEVNPSDVIRLAINRLHDSELGKASTTPAAPVP